MQQKGRTLLWWVYIGLLCLSIVIAGLCLMAQCFLIYSAGEHPFSRETVAAAFSEIAVPVYFCGAMVLLGILAKPFLPAPKKDKLPKNQERILSRLQSTTDLSACPGALRQRVETLRVRRVLVRNLGWLVLAVGSLVFLSYGANPQNFHTYEINRSMALAMAWLIPAMTVPFGYGIFAACHRKSSIRQEIDLLKSAPTQAKCAPAPGAVRPSSAQWLRYGILAAALVLMLGGYFLGGAVDVLTKAVNICTECIGLG